MTETFLKIHTVPSNWQGASLQPAPRPYRRVVAMDADGLLVTARYENLPRDWTFETYRVPRAVAKCAMDFLREYIIPADVEAGEQPPRPYTSHMLALRMLGEPHNAEEPALAQARVDELTEGYPTFFAANLRAGQHGVVERKRDDFAERSVLGLGIDTPDCLQTLQSFSAPPGTYRFSAAH
jgi:hypothetical protein